MIRFASLLLCALVLVACGPLPQPFRGGPKVTRDIPLIDIPGAMGVEVMQVTGLSPEVSARLTRAVADRLLDLEIPAEPVARAGALGFHLFGRAAVANPDGAPFEVTWTLRSRRGIELTQFNQTVQVPAQGPVTAARQTADQVAAAMGLGDAPVAVPGAPITATVSPALPTISVKPVEGAPGDGRESLRLAVLQMLTDAGFRRDDANPDIVVYSEFSAKERDRNSQDILISWRAVTRDGRELGKLDLDNTLPTGALERTWGPTAFAIAAAAEGGLTRLLAPSARP